MPQHTAEKNPLKHTMRANNNSQQLCNTYIYHKNYDSYMMKEYIYISDIGSNVNFT